IERITRLAGNPLALRALHRLVQRFFDGPPADRRDSQGESPPPDRLMILPKEELAASLGVSVTELEEALRPFVADETLRWHKTAAGEECYEFIRSDLFL